MIENVWVLTKEINDYNQEGEYFLGMLFSTPTEEKLINLLIDWYDHEYIINKIDLSHLLKGGGRKGKEYEWLWLREIERKKE